MAEVIAAIGVVASVAQLAEYGFKLSVKLFTFSQAVSSADQSIKGISNDVSLTSTVLQELSLIIKADESRVVSAGAIEATRKTVEECMKVFAELEKALDKSLGNLGQGDGGKAKGKVGRRTIALEKLKWPFKQPKMELLRSNLDRLKASLALMLQVLSYARDVSNRKAAESSLAYQQHLIETLARSERAMKQRYYSLQMTIENQSPASIFNTFAAASVSISAATQSRGIDDFRSPSPPPQYQKTPSPAPVVKPKILVGELLLCFQLLNDLLGHHVAVTKSDELSWLTQTLERVQKMGMKRLEVEFYEASPELKAEAARNLHARLRELARVGYLKRRVLEGAIGIADDTRSEPESSDIRPIEGAVSSAPDQGWEDELREAVEYQTRRIGVGRPVAVVSGDEPRDMRRERRLEAELGLDSSLSAAERLEMRRERGSNDPGNRRRPQDHGTLSESDYYGSTAPIARRAGRIRTASLAQRSKYQFEANSSDEEMENEIDRNLDALGHTAGRLNALARAAGQEVDGQNKHIDRIVQKSDRVDDQITMNRSRLDRIDQAGRLNQLATPQEKEVDTQNVHVPKTETKPPPPDTAGFDGKPSEADPHEEALAVMRKNIEKVLQRGEKIETLVDNTMGSDPLAVQSAIFRKQAKDSQAVKEANPWTSVFGSVPKLGSEMYKSIQGFGSSIYEASAGLVSEAGQRDHENGLDQVYPIGTADPSRFETIGEEQGDEDIVGDLLAKWTTLPSYEEATADD